MKNKENHIRCTVADLLSILDARVYIGMYIRDYKENNVEAFDHIRDEKVMYFLTDSDFMEKYGNLRVIGINNLLNITNILIEGGY